MAQEKNSNRLQGSEAATTSPDTQRSKPSYEEVVDIVSGYYRIVGFDFQPLQGKHREQIVNEIGMTARLILHPEHWQSVERELDMTPEEKAAGGLSQTSRTRLNIAIEMGFDGVTSRGYALAVPLTKELILKERGILPKIGEFLQSPQLQAYLENNTKDRNNSSEQELRDKLLKIISNVEYQQLVKSVIDLEDLSTDPAPSVNLKTIAKVFERGKRRGRAYQMAAALGARDKTELDAAYTITRSLIRDGAL